MHILLAVDGSKGAKEAVHTVARTPYAPGTKVTLLHVVTRYTPPENILTDQVIADLRSEEDRSADQVLSAARAELADRQFDIHNQHVEGHPAQAILDAATTAEADLIVIGALGLTGWIRVLLGSVSDTVVKHAPCPVWVVKQPIKPNRMDILVASDGSANARHAIDALCAIPFPTGTVCHLVHVLPSANHQLHLTGNTDDPAVLGPMYKIGEQYRQHGELVLKKDTETLSAHFDEVRPFTLEGDARRQILATAHEVEADLIVMGHKGVSAIQEFFLGSTSHKVLKHARGSVMITPLED
jgi:nucleotide-binding universal stress UspA family protein